MNQYRQTIIIQENNFIKEFVRKNPDWTKERRLEFLNKKLKKINTDILFWIGLINICDGWFGISIYKICFVPLEKKWLKIYFEINLYQNPKTITEDISEEKIQQAREYPIENLIEIKKNWALCINHNDHKPSMYCKKNYVYCFSCGYSADSIGIAMKIYNINFKEAVKLLTT